MSGTEFPAGSVVNWYIDAEQRLADVLRVIPYCQEQQKVWSPVLVTILQDSCSQLDSLWRYEAKCSLYVKDENLNIGHYFEYFGLDMSRRWVIFWGEEPTLIQPFKLWSGLNDSDYKKGMYGKSLQLDWWKAYQEVKHNRITNRCEATLERAVDGLAALFLAILRCEHCRDAIAQTGWLSSAPWESTMPQVTWLAEDSPSVKGKHVAAESKVFSYPFGWSNRNIGSNDKWLGNASQRFKVWFDAYQS